MSKFRKKPVVIEAIECSEVRRNIHNEPTSLPRWIIDAYRELTLVMLPDGIAIKTVEGDMLASADDWIIRGVNGELYPCKPDIFEKTYEAVESREWD